MVKEGTAEKTEKLAREFRSAILRCDRKDMPIGMQDFPNGACGDTSLLLSKYLQKNGLPGFEYVCGAIGTSTHAWLEGYGLIVDIVADGFDGAQDEIIVTKRSRWHEEFEIEDRHTSDFNEYDPRTAGSMGQVYEAILSKLKIDFQ